MFAIPEALHGRAFLVGDALQAGLTRRVLQGSRFVMLRPGVYRTASTEPTLSIHIEAARLVLPADVVVSHTTALWVRGLKLGPAWPLHFSIHAAGEINCRGVVVHRRQARMNVTHRHGLPVLPSPRRSGVTEICGILHRSP